MSQPASSSAPVLAPVAVEVAVDALAAQVIASYVNAEQDMLDAVGRVARRGLDGSAAARVAMLTDMQLAGQRIVTALRLRSGTTAARIIATAARLGEQAAIAEIDRAVRGHPSLAARYLTRTSADITGHAVASANAIALELTSALNSVNARVLRFAGDAYQAAVAEAATRLVGGGGETPVTAQYRAWSDLVARGVSGFTDRRGRTWNLSSYVEMATRTAVQRAYNASHLARMTAVGVEYFTVAGAGTPCPLCLPWVGAVMSAGLTLQPDSRVRVKGTLDEARAAGLFHPNCRHVLVPYFPGITRVQPPASWSAADQRRYDATQTLRRMERSVRAAKREQAGALDDLSRQRASRRTRALQAQIRGHVERHGLVRRRRREQLDLGNR